MIEKKSTIYKEFLKVVKEFPFNVALRYEGKAITYKKLNDLVETFGHYYASLNLKEGDTITLIAPNTPEAVASFLATSMKGLNIHLILPLASEETIIKEVQEKDSKLLIAFSLFLNQYPNIIKMHIPLLVLSPTDSLNIIKKVAFASMNKKDLKTYNEHKELPRKKNMKGKDNKIVDYPSTKGRVFLSSGGTSGEPKTIMLSDEAILSLIYQGEDIIGLPKEVLPTKSMLAALPMFHGFGLVMGVLTPLYYGASAALLPKFHTGPVIKLIKKGQITILTGVPVMYEALLRNPKFKGEMLKNLDVLFVGGDFISPSLLDRFNSKLSTYQSKALLLEGYGLTETVTVLSVNTIKEHRSGTIGKPLKNVEVKIVDEDHNLVSPHTIGEIIVSGETLMNGYYDGTDCFMELDGKKYVLTGDLGYLDEDGYLYFISRKKRVIKKKGMNIFPLAIEKRISQLDFIKECAYLAKDEPNKVETYLFVAIQNKSQDEALKLLEETFKKSFFNYEAPDHIIFKDTLPKTNVSKIDYTSLANSLK